MPISRSFPADEVVDIMALFLISACDEELSDDNKEKAVRHAKKFLETREKKLNRGHSNKTILGNGTSGTNKKRARRGR